MSEFVQGGKPVREGHYWMHGMMHGLQIAKVYWGARRNEHGKHAKDSTGKLIGRLRCVYFDGDGLANVWLDEVSDFWKFYHPAIERPAGVGPMHADAFIEESKAGI